MRILALDQSSRVSGWAFFNDDELIEYGKIDLSNEPQVGERLHKLRCLIRDMIQELKIEKVILEDIYLDNQKVNNVYTFKTLAEVFGVLFELCIDLDIPVEAVLAKTWKTTLNIQGKTRNEQKKSAQDWVQKKYNIKLSQDEADAICIGAHIIYQTVNNWGE